MAHMAGNEPNFDISSKKYDVQKTVPQKYKTAWALGLKVHTLIFEKMCQNFDDAFLSDLLSKYEKIAAGGPVLDHNHV